VAVSAAFEVDDNVLPYFICADDINPVAGSREWRNA